MKPLLIFIFLLVIILQTDLKPLDLDSLQKDTIEVSVEGAVKDSGTITMHRYDTVGDILDIVEPDEDADLTAINRNMIVNDHDVIVIPEQSEEKAVMKISVNQGDVEDLMNLPGIGKKTAEQIVEYREQNGLFQSPEDLLRVKGIGEKKLEKFIDCITL